MSEGLNRACLLGNIGNDPELHFTQNNTAVLNVRLATTTTFVDKDQKRQERTEWHSVKVWGKRGEGLEQVIGKGDQIYIEGEIRTSEYEKDGQKRSKTEIHADKVVLIGGRSKGRREGGEGEQSGPPRSDDRPREAPRGRDNDRPSGERPSGGRDDRPRYDDRRAGRGRDAAPSDDLPY